MLFFRILLKLICRTRNSCVPKWSSIIGNHCGNDLVTFGKQCSIRLMHIKHQTVGIADEFLTLHVTGKNLKTCGVSGGNRRSESL